jgi:EpsI family protein
VPASAPDVRASVRLLVVAALLVGTAGYLAAAARPEEAIARRDLGELPLAMGRFTGYELPRLDEAILEQLGADDLVNRIYRAPGQADVGLYVGYYTSQRQGDTIHSPMNCMPGAGWQPVETGRQRFEVGDDALEVNRVIIEKGEFRQLVLYWYQGRGRVIANEYSSKALMAWDSATRHRTDGALVRVVTVIGPADTPESAAQRAVAFVQELYPRLGAHVPA